MSLLKISAVSALSAGALCALAMVAPASAALVTASGTFTCPANSQTPCKVSLNAASTYYSDGISCTWTNPKVTLIKVGLVDTGTTLFSAAYALTAEERAGRGMLRTEPLFTVTSSQQLEFTFQATSSASNTITCYVLGY